VTDGYAARTGGDSAAAPGGDVALRQGGAALVRAIAGAMRSIRLYPIENTVVQNALRELVALSERLLAEEGQLELRRAGEFLFCNATRLRLDLDNYAAFSAVLGAFRAVGVGTLRWSEASDPRGWTVLLSYLVAPGTGASEDRFEALHARLEQAGVTAFALVPPSETDDLPEQVEAKVAAQRTYARSVAISREVMASVRLGQSPNLGKVKRVVQSLVDQILTDETSLVGLTTIRDYDDYTFTHSVNVCIFAVALGRRLGLGRVALFDLGLAALFHDIGKSRIPAELLNTSVALTEEQWRAIALHPALGVLALFQLREQQEHPYRAMVVAYQHHQKFDRSGYPRPLRAAPLTLFSRIVAVADGFDAATSRRVYQSKPWSPAAVLQEMRDNPRRGMDPVLVKAFTGLLGIYPVGTLVVLDTFELAIVHAVHPSGEQPSRPIVRIVSDDLGNLQFPGTLVDIAEQREDGQYLRTIIKTADPDRYGIRIGDYFR
jgi:HD-GYP domain-containing protein (c-di-GMP phosphodiesterase class II)